MTSVSATVTYEASRHASSAASQLAGSVDVPIAFQGALVEGVEDSHHRLRVPLAVGKERPPEALLFLFLRLGCDDLREGERRLAALAGLQVVGAGPGNQHLQDGLDGADPVKGW